MARCRDCKYYSPASEINFNREKHGVCTAPFWGSIAGKSITRISRSAGDIACKKFYTPKEEKKNG